MEILPVPETVKAPENLADRVRRQMVEAIANVRASHLADA